MSGDLYPHPSSASASAVMRGNRRTDTQPERALRSLLHGHGLRFRKDFAIQVADRRMKADIVFTRLRVAVFVDGCFWHRCPEHGNSPRSNSHYWGPKLDRNVARDREIDRLLKSEGWTVVRIWEHVPPEEATACIIEILHG